MVLGIGEDVRPEIAGPRGQSGHFRIELQGLQALLGATVFAETGIWLGGPRSQPPGALAYPALLGLLEVEPGTHALVLQREWLTRTVTAKLRAARRGRWELVYTPTNGAPRFSLFDLKADPNARRDVATEHPEVTRSLRAAMREWLAKDPLRWLDAREHLVERAEQ